ncbi:MAG: pyridoxamine kinase [Candidatus Limivicinus sp.]|nr:pyridoxamine kinase [Clostridiales bacterium]MDY3860522.1 pyridoxamine kinase [Candidatus Limivicinus sp.]
MKRIVSIQDISDIGKCSLTVALPVISAMGVECAVLPTAVLSAHSQFEGFRFHDLTDEMQPAAEHWKELGIGFDAIYTGYLGSYRQVDIVSGFFRDFGSGAKIIVDPAMADNGVLYAGFDAGFPGKMAELCRGADLILPNVTEACFMLGEEYREEYDRAYIRGLLQGLAGLGAKKSAVTGVSFDKDKLGVVAYDSETGEYFSRFGERFPAIFHGTGDIFASAVTGAIMNGLSVNDALSLAVDYTLECIRMTVKDPRHNWYGVNFEQAIPYLIKRLSAVSAGAAYL